MKHLSLLALALALSVSSARAADVVVNHQGRLLGADDVPVEGTRDLVVSLYANESTASPVWSETYSVSFSKGAYAIALGDTLNDTKKALSTEQLAQAQFVGVTVDSVALSPRLRIGTAPAAARAIDADQLGGEPAASYALKTYVDQKVAEAAPVGFARLDGAAFTGAVTVREPQAAGEAVNKAYADGLLEDAAAYTDSKVGEAFAGAPSFAPANGNVPFTVAPSASGVVQNLNAELLGGKTADEFLQVATYKPPASGAERLVLNFDEPVAGGTSAPVKDGSGNGNDGTLTSSGLTRTTTGHTGAAINFVGGGGLVTVKGAASLDITNNITLEAWVNPTQLPTGSNDAMLIFKPEAYGLRLVAGGGVQAWFRTAGAPTSTSWSPSSLPLATSTWTHVAATYDGLAVRIFVNGQLAVMQPFMSGPLLTSESDIVLGARDANGSFFNGLLDEVQVSAVAKPFSNQAVHVSSATRNAMTPPAGFMAFNTDTKEMNFFDGSKWRSMVSGFSVKRLNQTLESSITLHAVTPVREYPLTSLPSGTKAVLVGLFYIHGHSATNTHGYLGINAYQKGKSASETANFENYHFNDYYNSDYYELMIPWDPDGDQTLVLDFRHTLNDNASNRYSMYLRGAITAN